MKHKEFTTRTELKSLTRSIKCAETECGRLRMLSECLGYSSMRLGVPFIAPRQLGAIGGQQGRLSLPSIGWHTGQPLFMSGARSPSYSGADDRCRFVAVSTLDTVRAPCRPLARATRRPRIARPTVVLAAVGSPDSLVNYSRTPPNSPESGLFTGVQPGAPDTVRCARLSRDLAAPSQVFWFFSFLCF
jgi:hypothetical protein